MRQEQESERMCIHSEYMSWGRNLENKDEIIKEIIMKTSHMFILSQKICVRAEALLCQQCLLSLVEDIKSEGLVTGMHEVNDK